MAGASVARRSQPRGTRLRVAVHVHVWIFDVAINPVPTKVLAIVYMADPDPGVDIGEQVFNCD